MQDFDGVPSHFAADCCFAVTVWYGPKGMAAIMAGGGPGSDTTPNKI
jgi:hypothetical protein